MSDNKGRMVSTTVRLEEQTLKKLKKNLQKSLTQTLKKLAPSDKIYHFVFALLVCS